MTRSPSLLALGRLDADDAVLLDDGAFDVDAVLELDAALLGVVDHEVVEFVPVDDDLGVFREVQVLEDLVVVIGVRAVERDVVPPGPFDAGFFRGRRADHLEDVGVHTVEPGVADIFAFPAFVHRNIVSVFGEGGAAHHGSMARSRDNDLFTHNSSPLYICQIQFGARGSSWKSTGSYFFV